MNKVSYIVLFLTICSLASVTFMGCTDKKVIDSGPEYESITEKDQKFGHLDNPEWDPSGNINSQFDYDMNGSILVGVKAILTWTDDHHGSDSQDIYDVFSLTISAGSNSVSKQDGTGRIELKLGVDTAGNSTDENETADQDVPQGIGDAFSVTVACIECGTYDQFPFVGPFISYWDTGNDFSVDIEYDYLEPIVTG